MNTEKGRDLGCKELIKEQDTWFRFEIDDVKYIIVPNKTSALNLINHIENRKKIGDNIANRQIKDLLISKVTISEDLEGDM